MKFLLLDIKIKMVQSLTLAIASALMAVIAGVVHAQDSSQREGDVKQRSEARNKVHGNKESLTARKEPEKKTPNPGSGGDPDVRWSNPSPGIYRPNQGSGVDSNRRIINRSDQGGGNVRPKGSGVDRAGKRASQPNKDWGAARSNVGSNADSDARSTDRANRGLGSDRANKPIGRSSTGLGAASSSQGLGTNRASKMGGSGHHGRGH